MISPKWPLVVSMLILMAISTHAQKYAVEVPAEKPLRLYVLNNISSLPGCERQAVPECAQGSIQIIFKWTGTGTDLPTLKAAQPRKTDLHGKFNTIPADQIHFTWDPEPVGVDKSILIGHLTVDTNHFKDNSTPYSGYVVFSSDPPNIKIDPIQFQVLKAPLSEIPSFFESRILELSGTNFLPSFTNPLFVGIVYLLLALLYLLRKQLPGELGSPKVLVLISAVLVISIGMAVGISRKVGPQWSAVYVDDFPLTFSGEHQGSEAPREIGVLNSADSGWATINLVRKQGNYYLKFDDIARAGEYTGKIPADILASQSLSLKVRVADWLPYFVLAVLTGLLCTFTLARLTTSALELNNFAIVATSTAVTVLVSHFMLYTQTWGSASDYVKAFAAGAVIPMVTQVGLTFALRMARKLISNSDAAEPSQKTEHQNI